MPRVDRLGGDQRASGLTFSKRAWGSGNWVTDGGRPPSPRSMPTPTASEEVTRFHEHRLQTRLRAIHQIVEVTTGDSDLENAGERRFNVAMGILIILNIFVIAIETDVQHDARNASTESKVAWIIVDSLFVLVYMVEIAVRIYWQRAQWILSAWNWFDTIILAIAVLDIWLLTLMQNDVDSLNVMQIFRIVRLVRLVRLVKLVRLMTDLYVILTALWHALQTLSFLLGITVFGLMIYSVLAVHLIGRNAPLKNVDLDGDTVQDRFGTVLRSMYTLFQLMTLDGWEKVARPIVMRQPLLILFIANFLCLFTFGMLNMTVALVIEKTLHHTKMAQEQQLEMDRQKLAGELVRICSLLPHTEASHDDTGRISWYQFKAAISQNRVIADLFEEMGIAPDEAQELFAVLDWDGNGDLTVDEFMSGIGKLQRGSGSSWDFLATHASARAIRNDLQDLQKKVDGMAANQARWRSHLESRLQDLSDQMAECLSFLRRMKAAGRSVGLASRELPCARHPGHMGYPRTPPQTPEREHLS